MKAISIRMPEELLKWLRKRAARQTIETGKQYSINSLVVDVLEQERETDQGKGAKS
jgi:hypothetical protein